MRTKCLAISIAFAVAAAIPAVPLQAAPPEDDLKLRTAIESELREEAVDGKIEILDPRSGETRALTLVKLHDTVHVTGDGSAYVCVDFKDAGGRLYDVDVYMSKTASGYERKELLLHKVEGKDRIREPQGAQQPSSEIARGVREAIETWASREAALRAGAFPFSDPLTRELLAGRIESIHQGVHSTGDGLLYACVDVRAQGKVYDLDIYVRPSGDRYEVAEVLVHKVDGKDRLR
jgi:hypothetical protein